jgi:hypothetical protein
MSGRKSEAKRAFVGPRRLKEDDIKIDVTKIISEYMDWIQLTSGLL